MLFWSPALAWLDVVLGLAGNSDLFCRVLRRLLLVAVYRRV